MSNYFKLQITCSKYQLKHHLHKLEQYHNPATLELWDCVQSQIT